MAWHLGTGSNQPVRGRGHCAEDGHENDTCDRDDHRVIGEGMADHPERKHDLYDRSGKQCFADDERKYRAGRDDERCDEQCKQAGPNTPEQDEIYGSSLCALNCQNASTSNDLNSLVGCSLTQKLPLRPESYVFRVTSFGSVEPGVTISFINRADNTFGSPS